MPREALTMEQKIDCKARDFKGWVKMQMHLNQKTQTDVGKALGISQSMVSQMLKVKGEDVMKDPFSYIQVLKLCEFFGVKGTEREKLLTL